MTRPVSAERSSCFQRGTGQSTFCENPKYVTTCDNSKDLPHRWVDYKFQPVFQPSQGDGKFLAILPAAALRYRPRQLFLIDTVAGSRSLLTRHDFINILCLLAVSWCVKVYQCCLQGGGHRGDGGGEVDRGQGVLPRHCGWRSWSTTTALPPPWVGAESVS